MEKTQTTSGIPKESESFADSMNNIFNNLPDAVRLGQAQVSRTFSGFVECSGTVTPLRSNVLSDKERQDLLNLLEG